MADTDGSEPNGDNGITPVGDGNASAPKRKRGRPANVAKPADSGGNGIGGNQGGETANSPGAAETSGSPNAPETPGAVNPETFVSGEAPKKKRGRPPGSGTRTKAETAEALNIGDLASEIEG